MKAELITVPKKGLCILISEIDVSQFLKDGLDMPNLNLTFSDPHTIAAFIREKQKIRAIKAIREQTGWGLKEAKHYSDKYIPMGNEFGNPDYAEAADRFLADHLPITDFIKDEDLRL